MFELDARILALRCIMFFRTTGSSSIAGYLILFLAPDFTSIELGVIMGIRPLINFIASFLWGLIGDCTEKPAIIASVGILIGTIGYNILLFSFITNSFLYTILLMCICQFFCASSCLLDVMIIHILDEKKGDEICNKDETIKYGSTRLWGAIGVGIGSVICGWLLSHISYLSLFIFYDLNMMIVLFILIFIFPFLISNNRNKENKEEKEEEMNLNTNLISNNNNKQQLKQEWYLKEFINYISNIHSFLFLLNLFICGMTTALVENFLFLFLKQYFNANAFLCGFTLLSMICGEIPMFYFSKYFLNKIGIIWLLSLSHFAYSIRVFIYGLIPETNSKYAWYILIVEPLHGLTFAALWIASIQYATKIVPKHLNGTIQGLINAIYGAGLSGFIGCIIGGIIYQYYGPVIMYRYSGYIMLVWMIIFHLTLRLIKHYKPNYHQINILF